MAGQSVEIRREDWTEFLDEFSREHQGRQVDLEVDGVEDGGQIEAREVPLQGISADVRGQTHDISIVVGEEQRPGLTHIIPGARSLRVEQTPSGNQSALRIEARNGETTVLKLRELRPAA